MNIKLDKLVFRKEVLKKTKNWRPETGSSLKSRRICAYSKKCLLQRIRTYAIWKAFCGMQRVKKYKQSSCNDTLSCAGRKRKREKHTNYHTNLTRCFQRPPNLKRQKRINASILHLWRSKHPIVKGEKFFPVETGNSNFDFDTGTGTKSYFLEILKPKSESEILREMPKFLVQKVFLKKLIKGWHYSLALKKK